MIECGVDGALMRLLDNVKKDLDAGNAGLDAVEQYAGFCTPKLPARIGNSS